MLSLYRKIGIFAHKAPVRQVVNRVQKIDPAWIHPMHGGSFRRDIAPRFYQALREQPFAYEGVLRGRELPIEARAASRRDVHVGFRGTRDCGRPLRIGRRAAQ